MDIIVILAELAEFKCHLFLSIIIISIFCWAAVIDPFCSNLCELAGVGLERTRDYAMITDSALQCGSQTHNYSIKRLLSASQWLSARAGMFLITYNYQFLLTAIQQPFHSLCTERIKKDEGFPFGCTWRNCKWGNSTWATLCTVGEILIAVTSSKVVGSIPLEHMNWLKNVSNFVI